MRKLILTSLFLTSIFCAKAQNLYGLKATTVIPYRESLKTNPEEELIDLEKFIPGIVLDIRYATTNNFTKEKIYQSAKAYARKPVAEALKRAQAEFKKAGVGIKIYDAYRPYKATVKFYEVYHDTTYVASPYVGSRHNRGCAIDMGLVRLSDQSDVPMPTEFDSFRKEAWPTAPIADPVINKNRALIIRVMEQNGFKVNASEWWHFDFVGWRRYGVMDIDFEELELPLTGNR